MKSPRNLLAAALAATVGLFTLSSLRAADSTGPQSSPIHIVMPPPDANATATAPAAGNATATTAPVMDTGLSARIYSPTGASPTMTSLAGTWRFAMDRGNVGINEQWFNKDLSDHIKLPGILQSQGYGDDISTDTKWVSSARLGPQWWNSQPADVRDKYSQPGHVEVPFLSQPIKHYLGVAWYQRDINIPADWKDHRAVLFLERAHWQTTVYIDDKPYTPNDSLVAPHVTDLGVLTPGKHRLSIRIDNSTILPDDKQHLLDGHSVSDSLGATWNGIAGRIELSATTPVWIDDAQVFPNVAKKTAHVRVKLGNISGKDGVGTISYRVSPVAGVGSSTYSVISGAYDGNTPVKWDATGGSAEFDIVLSDKTKTWDEFNPNLQRLTLQLSATPAGSVVNNGGAIISDASGFTVSTAAALAAAEALANDRREITFGLREISFNDKDLLLNGQIINVRSTHSGGDFPLTGYPATDVASWLKIFQTCKDYGLNGMRFHSWCPPEAAFAAADQLGFYLAPECGMWNVLSPNTPMETRLYEESARILKAFGNHPSFILLSPSNEPKGNYQQTTPKWAVAEYGYDPRRLYSAGTGWSDPAQINGPQYASMPAFGAGQLRGDRGWFGSDYSAALTNIHIPVLSHEVGQWCAYPDFGVMAKFTGYLRPGNYDIFRDFANEHGLLPWNQLFAWSSGRFQVECYKEDIEANLRTPGLSGFQILDLHDYLGQGTALIGVLDAFWQPKSYVTAAEYRRFAGPTVPLARLKNRTFTTADTLASDVEIYNFGGKAFTGAVPYWKIVDAKGKVAVEGTWLARDIPVGKNIALGQVSVDLSKLDAPKAYKLVVGLKDTNVENDWNIWLYPAQISDAAPADVLITSVWADAQTRLAAGGKVLYIPAASDLDPAKCPPMQREPVFWNREMSPKVDAMLGLVSDLSSPALAEFPTDVNCDWQWTQIVNGVRSVNLDNVTQNMRPIVWAIDDWNRSWRLGVIFEAKVGPGSLLVSAIDLQNGRGGAVLQQLRRSVYDYVASDKFNPYLAMTPDEANKLWYNPAAAATTPAPTLPPTQSTNNPNSDVYEGPPPAAQ